MSEADRDTWREVISPSLKNTSHLADNLNGDS